MSAWLALLVGAYAQAKLAEQERAAEARLDQEHRDHLAWEDEHLLPSLSPEDRRAFLLRRELRETERSRRRDEDRRHRELLAVEERKARALEDQAAQARRSFLERLL